MFLGLALRAVGPALRAIGLVLRAGTYVAAPVAAVLAWGAIENGLDRKGAPREVGRGVH
ncbi:hypothetical protein GCM10023201_52730 [Actinomycetospora corticicola]|uniref:Uncharacterized protein n=1 Tax=Actinomycetospora corticicola TaxID=663602 RepID=A0A7Y9J6P2_9PSEU|nr:hypothetical protein [Actinomycetospora corticicola]NYD37463.1 hypothetical protein [Actinomycetospora corticicola]